MSVWVRNGLIVAVAPRIVAVLRDLLRAGSCWERVGSANESVRAMTGE